MNVYGAFCFLPDFKNENHQMITFRVTSQRKVKRFSQNLREIEVKIRAIPLCESTVGTKCPEADFLV